MESRWLRTASCSYAAAEDGTWRGHWIGRAWNPQGRLRGLSFASRRRGRVWAFWVGRDRRAEAPPWRERLAAATDDGHRRRAEFPYTDAEREMMRP
jgi:hypothetical protein